MGFTQGHAATPGFGAHPTAHPRGQVWGSSCSQGWSHCWGSSQSLGLGLVPAGLGAAVGVQHPWLLSRAPRGSSWPSSCCSHTKHLPLFLVLLGTGSACSAQSPARTANDAATAFPVTPEISVIPVTQVIPEIPVIPTIPKRLVTPVIPVHTQPQWEPQDWNQSALGWRDLKAHLVLVPHSRSPGGPSPLLSEPRGQLRAWAVLCWDPGASGT